MCNRDVGWIDLSSTIPARFVLYFGRRLVQVRRSGLSAAADVAPCPPTIRHGSYFNAGVPNTLKCHPHVGKGAPVFNRPVLKLWDQDNVFYRYIFRENHDVRGTSRPPPRLASGFSLISRHQYPNTWNCRQVLPSCRSRPAIHCSATGGNEDQIDVCRLYGVKAVLNSRETQQIVGDMQRINQDVTPIRREQGHGKGQGDI